MDDNARNRTLGQLDGLWKIQPQPLGSGLPLVGQAKELANSLTRWYVQAIVDQQNAFNAAVVQALQALAASDDTRHTELTTHIHLLHNSLNHTRQQIAIALRRVELVEGRVAELEQRMAAIEGRAAAYDNHLADLDEAQTALALAIEELRELQPARAGEEAA